MRKALDYISITPGLFDFPQIILRLVETKAATTDADKLQIIDALSRINVKASFRK